MSSENWTQDDLDHFRSAFSVMPYISAMLQGDEPAMHALFQVEEKSINQVATGMFSLCAILVDALADCHGCSNMEVIQNITMFLDEELNGN